MAPDSQLARLRPFRAFAWAVYLAVTTAFSLMITVSVVRSVNAMSPGPLPAAEPMTVEQCVAKARALFDDLETHRRTLIEGPSVRRADLDWSAFRIGWISRYREVEAHCRQEPLQRPFERLAQALDLYTTSAVQLAGEVGPTIDGLRQELDRAAPR